MSTPTLTIEGSLESSLRYLEHTHYSVSDINIAMQNKLLQSHSCKFSQCLFQEITQVFAENPFWEIKYRKWPSIQEMISNRERLQKEALGGRSRRPPKASSPPGASLEDSGGEVGLEPRSPGLEVGSLAPSSRWLPGSGGVCELLPPTCVLHS